MPVHYHPVTAIAEFMSLGGQTVPEDVDFAISPREINQFIDRVDEEATETFDAAGMVGYIEQGSVAIDHAGVLDGFIDAAYAALTGAIRVAGVEKATAAWDAVVDANLSKVDGRFGPAVIDPVTNKIGKPEGWIAPDIDGIINA